MKDKVPGHFYKEQLTKAPKPDYQKDFFFIEKVLGQKKVKGKMYYLVKYLYYPSKFNEYVPEENFKK
jgi:AAA+ superfamily predicted ATPase